jgi:hypothetical protein
MDADERAIYYYLKSLRPKFAPVQDIGRRAGSKHRFRYNRDWAKPGLQRMMERNIVEISGDGCYRLKPIPPEYMRGRRWATDEIAVVLRANGKSCHHLFTPEDEDAYYDGL